MFKKLFALFFCVAICFAFVGCASEVDKASRGLTNYKIDLSFDQQTNVLIGTQEVRYVNSSDNMLTEVKFHLYPNAFSQDVKSKPVSSLNTAKAYPNGMSYGGIEVSNMFVEGSSCQIFVEGENKNILRVPVGELYPDDCVTINFNFSVLLPNVHHRMGYGDDTYNFGNCYPIACVYNNGFVTDCYGPNGDPFYSDVANYQVQISFAENLTLASSGNVDKIEMENGIEKHFITGKALRDFAFVLGKNFSVETSIYSGVEVNYFYFNDENYLQSLTASVDSLKTFNAMFGKYPYSVLNVVQANFVHGGMEYPNLVYISNGVENYTDYVNVIVHEIAHQWWYSVVGVNEYDEAWIDEGLAEYSTLMFYEKNPTYNIVRAEKVKSTLASYILFVEVYTSVYGNIDTTMNRKLNQYKSEIEYVYMAYVKSMLLFDDLRKVVGDKVFLEGLKNFYKNNKFKNATAADLISAFENAGGKGVESFVNAWVEGKVVLQSF